MPNYYAVRIWLCRIIDKRIVCEILDTNKNLESNNNHRTVENVHIAGRVVKHIENHGMRDIFKLIVATLDL